MVLGVVYRTWSFNYEFEYSMCREDYMMVGNIPSLVSLFNVRPWAQQRTWIDVHRGIAWS